MRSSAKMSVHETTYAAGNGVIGRSSTRFTKRPTSPGPTPSSAPESSTPTTERSRAGSPLIPTDPGTGTTLHFSTRDASVSSRRPVRLTELSNSIRMTFSRMGCASTNAIAKRPTPPPQAPAPQVPAPQAPLTADILSERVVVVGRRVRAREAAAAVLEAGAHVDRLREVAGDRQPEARDRQIERRELEREGEAEREARQLEAEAARRSIELRRRELRIGREVRAGHGALTA